MTDRRVFARAQNVTFPTIRRVPRQTIAFLGMTSQRDLRFHSIINRVRSMFGSIKDADCTRYSLGSEQVGVLWHVPSSVHFAFVVD